MKANVKKNKFYDTWPRNEQDRNTFTTTDRVVHAWKRRILNLVFSEKAIHSAEKFVNKHVDRWCELLLDDNDQDWSQPQNMTQLSDCLLLDNLGDLCFGRSFETKEPGDNPLRAIPHAIASYLRFMYPVCQAKMY